MPQNVRFSCDGELFTMDTIHATRNGTMSLSLTGQGCHTTFPLINLKNFGSAKSIEETWVKTGDHVALASTSKSS